MSISVPIEELRKLQLITLLATSKALKVAESIYDAQVGWWREHAKGETLTFHVPMLGKVHVKKPSSASTKTEYIADPVKFAPDELKKLITEGKVIEKVTSRAAGKAAVSVTDYAAE